VSCFPVKGGHRGRENAQEQATAGLFTNNEGRHNCRRTQGSKSCKSFVREQQCFCPTCCQCTVKTDNNPATKFMQSTALLIKQKYKKMLVRINN